jgi:hypothetical protein
VAGIPSMVLVTESVPSPSLQNACGACDSAPVVLAPCSDPCTANQTKTQVRARAPHKRGHCEEPKW